MRLNKFHPKQWNIWQCAPWGRTNAHDLHHSEAHVPLCTAIYALHSGLILSWCFILHLPLLRYIAQFKIFGYHG